MYALVIAISIKVPTSKDVSYTSKCSCQTKSDRVLKQCDVIVRDGTMFMPYEIDKVQLQKPGKGTV